MAETNTGMTKAEMKKLLVRSKAEPVTCAMGVGENSAMALLILHKIKNGRALESELKKEFPDVRNPRFGTAFVDIDDNPKLVKFTLNKPVSGMAKRLIKTLKGTGFSKAIILTEDGSVMEQFEEEDEEAAAAAPAAGPTAEATGAPPPPAGEAPQTQSPAEKAAQAEALSKALAGLVPQIDRAAGDDAARKDELAKLARMANTEIKTGNLTYAANSIAQLKKALDSAVGAPPAPPPPPPPAGPQQTAADAKALTGELAKLIPLVAAITDATRKAELGKLAKDANVEIKTNNLTYAANTIARLKAALAAGTKQEAGSADGPIPASRIAWTNLRQEIAADVEKLRAALAKTYAGQAFAGEVESRFKAKVAPVLARFDDKLGTALDDLAKASAADRDERATAVRGQVGDYRKFAEGDAFIADLDNNPFVPLQIRARATAALAQVEQALA